MRNIRMCLLASFFLFAIITLAQSRQLSDGSYRSISIHDWTDEDKFRTGPVPYIQGFGPLSDSLSQAYGGINFYESKGEYFAIKHWGDYYLWYTKEYPELFNASILEYEYYWLVDDPIGMLRFIFSCENYRLNLLPIQLVINVPEREAVGWDECNRVSLVQNDPGTWEQRNRRFHASLDKRKFDEPANPVIRSTSEDYDLEYMRSYLLENQRSLLVPDNSESGSSNRSESRVDGRTSQSTGRVIDASRKN